VYSPNHFVTRLFVGIHDQSYRDVRVYCDRRLFECTQIHAMGGGVSRDGGASPTDQQPPADPEANVPFESYSSTDVATREMLALYELHFQRLFGRNRAVYMAQLERYQDEVRKWEKAGRKPPPPPDLRDSVAGYVVAKAAKQRLVLLQRERSVSISEAVVFARLAGRGLTRKQADAAWKDIAGSDSDSSVASDDDDHSVFDDDDDDADLDRVGGSKTRLQRLRRCTSDGRPSSS
jgi:hypothetical protein